MFTRIIKILPDIINEESVKQVANSLKNGNIVAIPTETVYGLAGNALDKGSIEKIYKAKGRPSDNPLIIHIGDKDDIYKYGKNISKACMRLIDRFWAGPLTVVVDKADTIPMEITGGLSTVAIRMPAHPVALAIIKECGFPLAAPSANISGAPSPTSFSHVFDDMNGRIDIIVESGDCAYGLESTIVDMSGDTAHILRPGAITREMLAEVIGDVMVNHTIINDNAIPKAPGMKYAHYAPKAVVTVYIGEDESVINAIKQEFKRLTDLGEKPMAIIKESFKESFRDISHVSLGDTTESIGKNLFFALREGDRLGATRILCVGVPLDGLGMAIMNRLTKASGHNVVRV